MGNSCSTSEGPLTEKRSTRKKPHPPKTNESGGNKGKQTSKGGSEHSSPTGAVSIQGSKKGKTAVTPTVSSPTRAPSNLRPVSPSTSSLQKIVSTNKAGNTESNKVVDNPLVTPRSLQEDSEPPATSARSSALPTPNSQSAPPLPVVASQVPPLDDRPLPTNFHAEDDTHSTSHSQHSISKKSLTESHDDDNDRKFSMASSVCSEDWSRRVSRDDEDEANRRFSQFTDDRKSSSQSHSSSNGSSMDTGVGIVVVASKAPHGSGNIATNGAVSGGTKRDPRHDQKLLKRKAKMLVVWLKELPEPPFDAVPDVLTPVLTPRGQAQPLPPQPTQQEWDDVERRNTVS